VRPEEREVGGAEAVGRGVALLPVRVDQARPAAAASAPLLLLPVPCYSRRHRARLNMEPYIWFP